MATPPIERKNNRYFRKYSFQATDSLIAACLSFGQPDWPTIYDLPENKEFRIRYPKKEGPLQGTAPVDLYLPLPEGSSTGLSLNGSASDSYILAIVRDKDGAPLDDLDLWLVPQETSKDPEFRIKTNKSGIFFMPNPQKKIYEITTPDFELEDSEEPAAEFEVAELDLSQYADRPTALFPLRPDSPAAIRARRSFYITCPMCDVDFKIVESMSQHSQHSCPNDGFDLSSIEKAILTEESSFLDPERNKQDPIQNPLGLKCRGTCPALLGPYEILRYWDESRFSHSAGEDYVLYTITEEGRPQAPIVGRKSWNAVAPIENQAPGEDRQYVFHRAERKNDTPYESVDIPDSQINPLKEALKWITVHHTAGPAEVGPNSVFKIQRSHQIDSDINKRAADIKYHFLIDASGTVFEARVLGIAGTHVEEFNAGNVGIVLSGDFENQGRDEPSEAAISALHNLIKIITERFDIRSVAGHNERKMQSVNKGTACPGKRLEKVVKSIRTEYKEQP